jgi:hypothetical protein
MTSIGYLAAILAKNQEALIFQIPPRYPGFCGRTAELKAVTPVGAKKVNYLRL